ncbi:glycosyltransferase [Microbacterium sp. NPDC096154]|uniref:glycosyltransferase family 2 protein n=1 Tax=Microbacterium sp. NPDC096154 TaxID=3155549 RepID=UPI00331C6E87
MTAAPDTLKASVVVATYRSGKGLDRLMRSLDAQTLPRDEWEVIFVDDGSPDDTHARLLKLAETRPHMRVERIENSGWPCRPRNIGTDLARGEYVVYMDHDDELYPDALRAGYEFAKAAGADALNGKEARTHTPAWAIDTYRADAPQVLDDATQFALSPTNPHKMYRRALLVEHGIRFREGGRVLWEDIFFNVLVAKHAKVVATLTSVPFYHWFATTGSGSTTFVRSSREWWYWLEEVLEAITTDLADDRLEAQRLRLLEHQYRSRVMDAFNNLYAGRPASEKKLIFESAQELQQRYLPESLDGCLNRTLRMRAQLLRRGYRHLLERLTVDDPNIPGETTARAMRWEDGVLVLELDGRWVDSTGRRHRVRAQGDRVVKALPPQYDGEFDPELLDVTDDLTGATVEAGIRDKKTRITWMVPTESESWLRTGGASVDFGVRATARIDPRTAAFGAPLARRTWEVSGRTTLAGTVQQRMTRSRLTPAIHIDQDGVVAAFARPNDLLVIDFDQSERPLTDLVRPAGPAVHRHGRLEIEVTGLPTHQDGAFDTTVWLNVSPVGWRAVRAVRRAADRVLRRRAERSAWKKVPATIRISQGRAQLEVAASTDRALIRLAALVPGAPGTYTVGDGRVVPRTGRLQHLIGH